MTTPDTSTPAPLDDRTPEAVAATELDASRRSERRLFWKELLALAVVVALVVVRQRWLL